MKQLKPFSSICFLALAVCVTAGSMYVTVNAAAQQDGGEFLPVPQVEDVLAPPVPVLTTVDDEVLEPDAVLHSRQHHITLDATGSFTGRFSALSKPDGNLNAAGGMDVKIIRDGAVLSSTITAEDGSFTASGLSDGVVAILATGSNGLLLYSVNLKSEIQGFADATPVSIQLDLNSAVVCASDVALVKELIMQGLPETDRRFNDQTSASEQSYPEGTNETSTSLVHHQVQLQPDGALVGQVNLLDSRTGRHREVLDLTLHFVRDGQHLAQTEVQRDGRFAISGLAPGIYSILTTGEDGILAMGLDVVGSLAQRPADSKYRLTSIAQALELCVCPVNAGNFSQQNVNQFFESPTQPVDEFGTPIDGGAPIGGPLGAPIGGGPLGAPVGGGPFGMGGGGPGGGFGGGSGGGLGGGGGIGGLLAAAAAGAVGFAVGDDDDDAPASPAR